MDRPLQSPPLRHSRRTRGLSMRVLSPLCNLGVLCVSVVRNAWTLIHHRHTENTKVAQRVILITLVLFLLVSVPEPAPAQDTAPADNWSQFRGNQRLTGVSDSQVPENLKLLWTFDAGDSIESSAAIVGGTVFVGSQKGELVAVNLDNGSVYWKYQTGSAIGESSPA